MSRFLLMILAGGSVRILLFGLLAFAISWRLRSAAVRHAVWTAVLAAMLLIAPLELMLPPLAPPAPMRTAVAYVVPPVPVAPSLGMQPVIHSAVPPVHRRFDWMAAVFLVYAVVGLALLVRLAFAYRRMRRLVARANPVTTLLLEEAVIAHAVGWPLPRLVESPAVRVPFTAGWREPVIILPEGWRDWSESKLRAVLLHEVAHIRRRDWLTALLAAINCCLFWFHPLAWYVEHRLAALAEDACDDASVFFTGDATGYAGVLLEFARGNRYDRRLALHSVTMATSRIERRIDRVLAVRRFSSGVARAGVFATVILCTLPLLYAAAALQVTPPAIVQQFGPDIDPRFVEGFRSLAEIAEAEARLAQNPEDLRLRQRLMVRYQTHDESHAQALGHMLWFIEHHPDSLILRVQFMVWPASLREQRSRATREAWNRQVANHPDNADVLMNAALFVSSSDLFTAEAWLKKASKVPANARGATNQLLFLYTQAFSPSPFAPFPSRNVDPVWEAHVKTTLETSTEAIFPGWIGRNLFLGARLNTTEPKLTLDQMGSYSEVLVARARQLEPDNPEWKQETLLKWLEYYQAGMKARQSAVTGNRSAKVTKRVDPIYPPLARKARIQGIVRFLVLVTAEGKVAETQLVSGHPLLVQAALIAIKQWEFEPADVNGKAMPAKFEVAVPFVLTAAAPAPIGDAANRDGR
ncbi:MAG: M56 family metallopeptidase [Acidobacteria bacterium]|nr:M56 family metallopeptidase [Acidobacteriota bacterium]